MSNKVKFSNEYKFKIIFLVIFDKSNFNESTIKIQFQPQYLTILTVK